MSYLQHIFRAYDIRGTVPEELNNSVVFRLGQAIGTYLHGHGVCRTVIGRDCRLSSTEFSEALQRGLCAAGLHCIDIGMTPTPTFYFAVQHTGCQGGVMITASHNPPQYNGFKIWCGDTTIHGAEIMNIYKLFSSGNVVSGHGTREARSLLPAYEDAIVRRVRLHRPVRVVVDGGNGVGGDVLTRVLRRLGAEVLPLFCEADGAFPHHHPDPVIAENMRFAVDAVRESGAELGIGLDGDADRLGVIDATGRLLAGDELLAVFAHEVLERLSHALILADVKCSQRLFDDLAARGGQAEMGVTGHSIAKARMLETNAPLGGELSGHIFFNDGWFGFDDAIYGAARLLDILTRPATPPLTALPGWPPTCSTPEIHIPCPDACKACVIKAAQAFFSARYPTVTIDGVRIHFAHGWGLVRASNTQPVLTLRCEADDMSHFTELRRLLKDTVARCIDACGA